MYDLVRAALRQRPNYIVVGEVRGKETYTMFQAMATGHPTMSTMHADSVKSMVIHVDLPAGLAIGPAFAYAGPGRARDPVLVRQVDLTRVLDGDDLRPGADEQCGAVQGGGLSGGGAPADHH